jgi:ribonuclease H / adenosylcobalamin/alpha-ribazole phosphatase
MGSLFLIRHATTASSASGRNLGGRSDSPLAPAGATLARDLGRALAVELAALGVDEVRAISSSALRCRQTLELALEEVPMSPTVEADPSLLEIDYGAWEGLTAAECMDRDPELRAAWEADPYHTSCPGGESGSEVAGRAFPALDRITAWVGERGPRCALVVSHNHPTRLRITATLGLPLADYRRAVTATPGCYSIITTGADRTVVRRINVAPPTAARGG